MADADSHGMGPGGARTADGANAAANASWDDLRAFVAVAAHGSMNQAGLALGESQPTIGRRMRRLERALGVALLERGRTTPR